MASEKNERLVNLTIALLATKKYLTKAQIFKLVEGYDGSNEAADRMFERDKEELRALGIDIEISSSSSDINCSVSRSTGTYI